MFDNAQNPRALERLVRDDFSHVFPDFPHSPDFSDSLGRLRPSETAIQKTLGTPGVVPSSTQQARLKGCEHLRKSTASGSWQLLLSLIARVSARAAMLPLLGRGHLQLWRYSATMTLWQMTWLPSQWRHVSLVGRRAAAATTFVMASRMMIPAMRHGQCSCAAASPTSALLCNHACPSALAMVASWKSTPTKSGASTIAIFLARY